MSDPFNDLCLRIFTNHLTCHPVDAPVDKTANRFFKTYRQPKVISDKRLFSELLEFVQFSSPLKKALLTGFHSTAKHNATKAVSPSSETMRTI